MIPDRRFKMQKAIESKENVKHVGEFWQIIDLIQWWLLSSHSVVSDFSVPGFSILRHLLKLAQTLVHWVGVAIQPSCPLLSPSPPAFHVSQHQGLFQWVSSSHQVAKLLELQFQHQPLQWIFRVELDWQVWSPCSLSDSRVFSSTAIRRHQFFGTQPSLRSNSYAE